MKKVLLKATLVSIVAAASFSSIVSANPTLSQESSNSVSTSTNYVGKTISASKYALNLNGRSINFNIDAKAQGKVTEAQLQAIAQQALSGGVPNTSISIHSVSQPSSPFLIAPLADINWYLTFSNISRDNAGSASVIITAAKGQTVKLTQSKTLSLSRTISYEMSATPGVVTNKLTGTINQSTSETFTTEITYSGPPESSTAVSRKYMWTPFYDAGKWRCDGYEVGTNKYVNTYTGNYTEPKYGVSWSMDVY